MSSAPNFVPRALLVLALLAGGGLAWAEEPRRPAPPKKPAVAEDLLRGLPPGALDPEALKDLAGRLDDVLRRQMDEALRALDAPPPPLPVLRRLTPQPAREGPAPGLPGPGPAVSENSGAGEQPRLGARVARPPAALADQLDLPKGQGVLLLDLGARSPAALAGMKINDVLLELDGRPVPNDANALTDLLANLESGKPIPALVLRKGRREVIDRLTLAEARFVREPDAPLPEPGRAAPPEVAPPARAPLPQTPLIQAPLTGSAAVSRSCDDFVVHHSDGGLRLTVTGRVDDGRATVKAVRIQGPCRATITWTGLDGVPAEQREKVRRLADLALSRSP